jgi:leucyl-tRNA synthetase
MSKYQAQEIEEKWQKIWAEKEVYKAEFPSDKPKYYVLDMFPYPSGAGLHVGHPLGYIASDIVARFKKLKGFNVLHPMGFDSFGLPAEQYAIQTGQHPKQTTEINIKRYKEQLNRIGFAFDWSREVQTSDPGYYKWTQWIFLKLFNSWYNPRTNKAEHIDKLIAILQKEGFSGMDCDILTGEIEEELPAFSAEQWKNFSEEKRLKMLMNFRLAYLGEAFVNWCPDLGTVLANDEVKDGFSERGGYPVERKRMKQWSMRITNYSNRLLKDLETLNWRDSLKESQKNWIGKSQGCSVFFGVKGQPSQHIEVFTTRPDTLFGVTFLTLAPEHDLVNIITTAEQKEDVSEYVRVSKNRSERERMAEVDKVSGVFTGAYVIHPVTNVEIPIWVGDYVLVGYGTGAVMSVPAHDSRDYAFAKHFSIEIKPVIEGADISEQAFEAKTGKICNSHFLNGLEVKEGVKEAIKWVEENSVGKRKVNFRLRDAAFGRQRYWGEPIPIYYNNGVAYPISEKHLPLVLPDIDLFKPTEKGDPPLARATSWYYVPEKGICQPQDDEKGNGGFIETSTMPGWAGSSWYFFRYMDPNNLTEFASEESLKYWGQVDLYLGGSEHATGHLLYCRFWTKVLFDLGYLSYNEPAKQLINQGMIQGTSSIVYRTKGDNKIVSAGLKDKYEDLTALHVDIALVNGNEVDIEGLKKWRPKEFGSNEYVLENGSLMCDCEVEKMSKRWHNVVNPDDICKEYGADTLRLYEMFLGPLEEPKPWNTQGIEGVIRFLRKLWRLFHQGEEETFSLSDNDATDKELKALHKLIKKATADIEHFSFNTSVSAFMVCVNELSDLKCTNKEILQQLIILISPYAPHITEELWQLSGNNSSITNAAWPKMEEKYLKESAYEYPISINGKVRAKMTFDLNADQQDVEAKVMANEKVIEWVGDKAVRKFIFVKGRIINVVI